MHGASGARGVRRSAVALAALLIVGGLAGNVSRAGSAAAEAGSKVTQAKFTQAKAFDVSRPLRDLAKERSVPAVNEAAVGFGP
jgi:hypothetical protein